MSTFVLIHGAGDSGWAWHRVTPELQKLGHDVVVPDLPADDDDLELSDYADAVEKAVGDRKNLIVVAHSFGGFTGALVAARLPVEQLIYLTAMVPKPGEPPGAWWKKNDYQKAVDEQSARDGGLTGNDDPMVCYYHDVPKALAAEAMKHERKHPSEAAMETPWPQKTLPKVPTRFILCTEDRFFPEAFMRRVVSERLGVEPEPLASGHCAALAHPAELARLLAAPQPE